MDGRSETERVETVVVGGGQAGLAVGRELAKRGQRFVILDASERVGDQWRRRWDSLRLFTPACYDSLDGMRFPAPRLSFPARDEMADYLEAYAARFKLPIRHGFKVDRLARRDGSRVLPTSTPMGRRARPRMQHGAAPLIRVKSRDLAAAGVERVARVTGARNGLPQLADGRVLDVANVIWCTGYETKFDWIDLPVFDQRGDPMHRRGEVAKAPGLYFVGLQVLYAFSSTMIH